MMNAAKFKALKSTASEDLLTAIESLARGWDADETMYSINQVRILLNEWYNGLTPEQKLFLEVFE